MLRGHGKTTMRDRAASPRTSLAPDKLLTILLGAGLVLRLALAWAPFDYLAHRGPLIDDAFYGFSIARNLARGAGATADGLHPTSGFQPLYTALLVPFYRLLPQDPILPIHLALTLLALCGSITGWLIYRMVRRFASRRAALFSLFLWTFSPALLVWGANGLETALFGLLLTASLEYYLGSVRPSPAPARLIALGALLGLTVLSRVDGILLAAGICLDMLCLRVPMGRRLKGIGTIGIVATLVVSPYLFWLHDRFGAILPESGRATRFLSLCYGSRFVLGARSGLFFPPDSPPLFYYWGSLRKALQVLQEQPVLFPASLLTSVAGLLGWLGPQRWVLVAGGALLWVANLAALRRPAGVGEGAWKGFARVAGVCALLWIPAYAFVGLGQWWFSRYFFPLFLFCTIVSGVALDRLGEGVAALRRLGLRRFALLACGIHLLAFAAQAPGAFLQHKPNLNVSTYLVAVQALDAQLPPGSRAGAFQSGTLGYFSKSHVVNLDGVVNGDAARALREKRMVPYIREEGIEAVIDWPWIMDALLVRRSPEGSARQLGPPERAGPFLMILVEPSGERLAQLSP
jgi:dolichyl-phosphate-mannose-protein mannosyltransferase